MIGSGPPRRCRRGWRPATASAIVASVVVAAGLCTTALPTGAQPRVGMLVVGSRQQTAEFVKSFEDGMLALGYLPGRTIRFEHRFANGQPELLPELAAEMVRLKLDVIVSGSNQQTSAAKRATTTIPIVAMFLNDPVSAGFVTSLSRPGANVTGLTLDVGRDLPSKRLELLKELAPHARRVVSLSDPGFPGSPRARQELGEAARRLDLTIDFVDVRAAADLDGVFDRVRGHRADAVFVSSSPALFTQRKRIIALLATARLPAISNVREFAEDGGLMSYGVYLPDLSRRAATYVDKILKGSRPGDLPVEQPTKFDFVINLKTARALGLTIPLSLLLRADHVIE